MVAQNPPLYMQVGVIIAPMEKKIAANQPAKPPRRVRRKSGEADERPAGRPSKSGEFDETIFAGSVENSAREFTSEVMLALREATNPKRGLFAPLTLPKYEALVRQAAIDLGFEHLNITPHKARHAGPSYDAYHGLLSVRDIMMRGRWKALSSVRRYQKAGKYQRQLELMAKSTVKYATGYIASTKKSGLRSQLLVAARSLRALRRAGPVPPRE